MSARPDGAQRHGASITAPVVKTSLPSTATARPRKAHRSPRKTPLAVEGAHEGIIPVALFNRVQRKLPHR